MDVVLFVIAWPLALICPLLPRARLIPGMILFLAWQVCLWGVVFSAMNSPEWNDSPGDMLVPFVITLPLFLFLGMLCLRGLCLLLYRGLARPERSPP
jgi:hypothetical protein